MKAKWYKRIGLSIAIMLCFSSAAMAAESDSSLSQTAETVRQGYVEALAYHGTDEGYSPAEGDAVFYDFNQDGIADGRGVVYAMGDSVIIGDLVFDMPGAKCGLYTRLQESVMGYGEKQEQAAPKPIPVAADFVFI